MYIIIAKSPKGKTWYLVGTENASHPMSGLNWSQKEKLVLKMTNEESDIAYAWIKEWIINHGDISISYKGWTIRVHKLTDLTEEEICVCEYTVPKSES